MNSYHSFIHFHKPRLLLCINEKSDSNFGIQVDNERQAIFVAARTKYSPLIQPYAIATTDVKKGNHFLQTLSL